MGQISAEVTITYSGVKQRKITVAHGGGSLDIFKQNSTHSLDITTPAQIKVSFSSKNSKVLRQPGFCAVNTPDVAGELPRHVEYTVTSTVQRTGSNGEFLPDTETSSWGGQRHFEAGSYRITLSAAPKEGTSLQHFKEGEAVTDTIDVLIEQCGN
ncbi:MAG: hypothetical protein LBJ70_05120 [Holosporales bacterium]|nr:hypothetical protein [Holosporales bacterium]